MGYSPPSYDTAYEKMSEPKMMSSFILLFERFYWNINLACG